MLGILSVGANTFIGSQASDWFPFVVVVAVLLIAPNGLFASGDSVRTLWAAIAHRNDRAGAKA
ncbi:hypothetical protein GCM10025881_28320 [Pseudolysinimonas kribbensis]|uniref:Branched-chain amino acid ABC transporter permease n=1 Tax=Pseudolysinimonas kribbensis TaxID=433641 RepID=A0ABQ6K6F3_9MICO|nr:hypothetical protein GCM10025881_28320 [Pseudolysinimonas kribbensis]